MSERNLGDIQGEHSARAHLSSVAAGDATEEQAIFRAPFRCFVKRVSIIPNAAVTGDDTDRKNLNVRNKGSDGSGTTELGALDLDTGTDLVAFDAKDIVSGLSESSTGAAMAEGDVLGLQVEKVGTGVIVPESMIEVIFVPAALGA